MCHVCIKSVMMDHVSLFDGRIRSAKFYIQFITVYKMFHEELMIRLPTFWTNRLYLLHFFKIQNFWILIRSIKKDAHISKIWFQHGFVTLLVGSTNPFALRYIFVYIYDLANVAKMYQVEWEFNVNSIHILIMDSSIIVVFIAFNHCI